MRRSGAADLPLHYGQVPPWLAERMAKLGLAITESILTEYSKEEFLRRLSDPFWFQSFGAVMGMDWHSSGITTSVMGALRKSINPVSKQLGIYICGGKGKFSRNTPSELLSIADKTGLNGNELVRCSKLSAKVDNTAIQDGFQLYMHNFIVADSGEWTVIQQGMQTNGTLARRYHWHSAGIKSFTEEPHTGICGINQGQILNLTANESAGAKQSILDLVKQNPEWLLREFQHLIMPSHHEVKAGNVNMKKLGAALWLAHDAPSNNFDELLLSNGVGPRTIQSLSLVSEVIHGTSSRFKDPARFSFAHGGKDGHPFPVPTKVYDETIMVLEHAVQKAKLGDREKNDAIKKLHLLSVKAEESFISTDDELALENYIQKEKDESWRYGGKTVFGDAKKPKRVNKGVQLRLF
jgi:hypothetical protein